MIDIRKKKRGLFGSNVPEPIGTPPIAGNDPMQRMGEPAGGLGVQAPQEAQQGGKKRNALPYVLAALEDTLSRQMGYAPQGVARLNAMQAERQQQAQAQADAQRKRSMEMSDWRAKEDYKAQNDRPTIQQNYEYIARTQGKEFADKYAQNYGQRPDEPRMIATPNGTFFGTMAEIQAAMSGQAQAPQAPARPVGGLRPMGGPASQAPGSF